jgi:DNA end-binding protein Ku
MAARATWKGVLQISLVQVPIKVFPATAESESLSFNQLHGECQTRITQRRWCTTCAREVPNAEIVKGFEFEAGKYVLLLPEELDAVAPPSTKVIDLTRFVDVALLNPLFVDRSYYLAPDGPLADEAFVLMREGMLGQVGIGKLAIYGREYLVAVRPHQSLLLLHTLHHTATIRPSFDLEEWTRLTKAPVVVGPTLRLARDVIAALHQGALPLAGFRDEYQADLRRIIDAKIAGQEIVEPTPVDTLPVLNLRAALEQSLEAVSATKKIPAKAAAPASKRKRA